MVDCWRWLDHGSNIMRVRLQFQWLRPAVFQKFRGWLRNIRRSCRAAALFGLMLNHSNVRSGFEPLTLSLKQTFERQELVGAGARPGQRKRGSELVTLHDVRWCYSGCTLEQNTRARPSLEQGQIGNTW
jgi:hypothetical protein